MLDSTSGCGLSGLWRRSDSRATAHSATIPHHTALHWPHHLQFIHLISYHHTSLESAYHSSALRVTLPSPSPRVPMKSFLLLTLCLFASLVMAQVPIPNRPDGYALSTGPATAPVVIDAFFDLLCPDSKAAWPIVKSVIAAYPSQLYLLLHTFPLPYHTNSFIANQGLHVIDHSSQHNRTALTAFTDLMFSIQSEFYNAATVDSTITEVIAGMAAATEKAGLLSAKAFTAGIANSDINEETRISWKYTCSRAVTGTPTFFLNGVYISADATWTLSDWKSVIDPILKANAVSAHRHPQYTFLASQKSDNCTSGEKVCNYAPHESECCLAGEECILNVGCRCAKAGGC